MKNKVLLVPALSLSLMACKKSETVTSTNPIETVVKSEPAAAENVQSSSEDVKKFLNEKFLTDADKRAMTDADKKFSVETADLNGDGKPEKLVYLQSPYFCGSGGCTFLLLSPENELVTKFTVTDAPFYVLKEKQNGWSNLAVNSGGKIRVLKFDGKKYPSNPSVAGAADFKEIPAGAVELFGAKSRAVTENF